MTTFGVQLTINSSTSARFALTGIRTGTKWAVVKSATRVSGYVTVSMATQPFQTGAALKSISTALPSRAATSLACSSDVSQAICSASPDMVILLRGREGVQRLGSAG